MNYFFLSVSFVNMYVQQYYVQNIVWFKSPRCTVSYIKCVYLFFENLHVSYVVTPTTNSYLNMK